MRSESKIIITILQMIVQRKQTPFWTVNYPVFQIKRWNYLWYLPEVVYLNVSDILNKLLIAINNYRYFYVIQFLFMNFSTIIFKHTHTHTFIFYCFAFTIIISVFKKFFFSLIREQNLPFYLYFFSKKKKIFFFFNSGLEFANDFLLLIFLWLL